MATGIGSTEPGEPRSTVPHDHLSGPMAQQPGLLVQRLAQWAGVAVHLDPAQLDELAHLAELGTADLQVKF